MSASILEKPVIENIRMHLGLQAQKALLEVEKTTDIRLDFLAEQMGLGLEAETKSAPSISEP